MKIVLFLGAYRGRKLIPYDNNPHIESTAIMCSFLDILRAISHCTDVT